MAETKSKKTIENFADELDSMLTVDDLSTEASLMDDDEALDRLLVGNVDDASEQEHDDLLEIDALIANAPEIDAIVTQVDEFAEDLQEIISEADESLQQQDAELQPEVDDLDITQDLDALAIDDEVISAENAASSDELAEDGRYASADFDISTDEENDAIAAVVGELDTRDQQPLVEEELIDNLSIDESGLDEANLPQFAAVDPAPTPAAVAPIIAEPVVVTVDHSQELVTLTNQIKELKKQNLNFKHSLEQAIETKADKEAVTTCLDSIESLQTGQKKVSRNLDAVSNRKPVAAWVASGIGVLALATGVGLGFQGVIAKSQVGELLTMLQEVKQQTEAAPAANAADQEMLRKQLDEMVAANGAITQQIQELSKRVESGDAPADATKQLADLVSQIQQMGAAVEAIQNRLANLEKGKVVASVAKAPVVAKKPVAEENWAVNLVAFKQDWYAQRKAEEFAGKGVSAHVVRSDSKGETWYRLSVDGFKTQYEAAAYAARVKKTLNLDGVWVAKN